MQDDNHQDFFEFEDNFRELPERQGPPRRRWGKIVVILVIGAVMVAALTAVLGILRSDDSTLQNDLLQTYSIQPPPPVSQPAVEPPTSRPSGKIAKSEPAQDKAAAEPMSQAASGTDAAAPLAKKDGVSKTAAAPQGGKLSREPLITSQEESVPKSLNPAGSDVPPKKKPASEPGGKSARPASKPPTPINLPEKDSEPPNLITEIRQGHLQQAALVYKQYFSGHPARYSISLEVACQPKTVLRAFAEVAAAGEMFILPAKIGDRSCFAVLWGNYRTLKEAKAARTSVPPFFTSQTSPRIVALSRYLVSVQK